MSGVGGGAVVLVVTLLAYINDMCDRNASPTLTSARKGCGCGCIPISPMSRRLVGRVVYPIGCGANGIRLDVPVCRVHAESFALPLQLRCSDKNVGIDTKGNITNLN